METKLTAPDAAHDETGDDIARRWFLYIVCGAAAIIGYVAVFVLGKSP